MGVIRKNIPGADGKMKKFISLLKTQINSYYGISAIKYKYFVEKKQRWELDLAIFGIVVGVAVFLFIYVMQLEGLFAASIALNQPHLMLAIVLFLGQIVTLIFGFFWVISVFYFSDDVKILLPLPLQPYEILLSKYTVILVNEYAVLALLLLPAIGIYGIGTGAGILYYLIALVVFLFSPVIPLSIDSIIALWLMRFTNLRKKKDFFTVLISILALMFFFVFQYFVNRNPQYTDKDSVVDFLIKNADLAKMATKSFPPSLWGAYAMSDYHSLYGFFNLLLFIAVSLIFTGFLALSAQKVYFKALMAGQEIGAKKKTVALERSMKASGALKALILREWKLFIRVPVYAMNVLPVAIIVPFIFFISFVGNPQMGLEKAVQYTSSPTNWFWVSIVGLLVSLFLAGSTSLSSTAFSREGKMFYISKILPISPSLQLRAKLILGSLVSIFVILPSYIIGWYIFKIPLVTVAITVFLSLPGVLLINILGLLIDSARPFFDWDNPQKAMKGNVNVLFTLVLTLLSLLIILTIIFLLKTFNVSEILIAILIEILIILADLKLYSLTKDFATKLYFEKE